MYKGRIMYLGLMAALMTALYLVRVYAGDANPSGHGIIQVLLSM
jgi:hypothetical protein